MKQRLKVGDRVNTQDGSIPGKIIDENLTYGNFYISSDKGEKFIVDCNGVHETEDYNIRFIKVEHAPEKEANPKQAFGDTKVPLQLMIPAATVYTCVALREGAMKYGAWNFRETDIEFMTYVGAMKRHLDAIIDGEWYDEEPVVLKDGTVVDLPPKPHMAGLMASAAIVVDAYERGKLIDNRPMPGNATELLEKYKYEKV